MVYSADTNEDEEDPFNYDGNDHWKNEIYSSRYVSLIEFCIVVPLNAVLLCYAIKKLKIVKENWKQKSMNIFNLRIHYLVIVMLIIAIIGLTLKVINDQFMFNIEYGKRTDGDMKFINAFIWVRVTLLSINDMIEVII